MISQSSSSKLEAYAQSWRARHIARAFLTTSGFALLSIRYAGLDNAPGQVALALVIVANLYDVVFLASHELAKTAAEPSGFLALARRELRYLGWFEAIEYLGVLAVVAKLVHHELDSFDEAMVVLFIAAALFIRFVLRRLAKRGEANVSAAIEAAGASNHS